MKYNIGDTVWYAKFGTKEKRIVCADCCGKKYLTIIMGDGSEVTIDCTGCQSGCEPPRGYNIVYEGAPQSEELTITGVELNGNKEFVYKLHLMGCSSYHATEDRLFRTKEEADAKAQELAQENEAEQLRRSKILKHNRNHTWVWNATYHRKQIRQAQKDIEYHTAKLNVAKEKTEQVGLIEGCRRE